jgi:(R)-amidase
MIIFPELSLTGYVVRDQIYELAEPVPGPSTRILARIAQKAETHVIFGMRS